MWSAMVGWMLADTEMIPAGSGRYYTIMKNSTLQNQEQLK